MAAAADRSFQEILQDIIVDIREIVTSEVRLTKAEVREEVGRVKSPALLTSTGVLIAFFSFFSYCCQASSPYPS